MPVFDCHADLQGNMANCWFLAYLNPPWAALSAAERTGITQYVNNMFDVAVRTSPHRFNVTNSVPSDWTNMALQRLYEVAVWYDVDDAAKLLGNLFCPIGIRRPELWCCFQQKIT